MSIGLRIRIVPTASGNRAIQVVSKSGEHLTVHKHIGSFKTEDGKLVLMDKAHLYIESQNQQPNLFATYNSQQLVKNIDITASQPLFAYKLFSSLYDKLGFNTYNDALIKDLVIARLYQPGSKLASQDTLAQEFSIEYSMRTIYRHIKKALKDGIQHAYCQAMIDFSRQTLGDELHLVFYDVTTLYFDSQLKTDLKNFGFSKDHRPADTQIVVGLVVNKQGFPLYFDIFAGNSFEGHTFIPVVKTVKRLLKRPNLVVVADAAMLSRINLEDLNKAHIHFVIGARMANLPVKKITTISESLSQKPGTIETTYDKYRLVCDYSEKRATRDRQTIQKAINKANQLITQPAKATSRYRFVKKTVQLDSRQTPTQPYELNQVLIDKAQALVGMKGYVTNTSLDATLIIERYHDLWLIERAFRISKSDLLARPIHHKLDDSVKAHVCLVFATLAITKYLDIETGLSHRQILAVCSKMLTHTVVNKATGESVTLDTKLSDDKQELINRLQALTIPVNKS